MCHLWLIFFGFQYSYELNVSYKKKVSFVELSISFLQWFETVRGRKQFVCVVKMGENVDIKSVVDDYMEHRKERENEYMFVEGCEVLLHNITLLKGEISPGEFLLLEQALNSLNNATKESSWTGNPFEIIMEEIVREQADEKLSVSEVVDMLIRIKRRPENAFESSLSKEKWLEMLFKDLKLKVGNVKAITTEVERFPLHVLENFFSNIKNFDEKSALKFFQKLNTTKLGDEFEVEFLTNLADNHESFDEGNTFLEIVRLKKFMESRGIPEQDIDNIFNHFGKLLEVGWQRLKFLQFISTTINTVRVGEEIEALKYLGNCFTIAFDYSFDNDEFWKTFQRPITSNELASLYKEIEGKFHEKALSKFEKAHEKTLEELLSDIESSNGWSNEQTSKLRADYDEVMNALKSNTNLIGKVIDSCSMEDIKLWVKKFNETTTKPQKAERVAVVMKAIGLFKGYTIRKVQLLSLLMFYKPEAAGTLAQINTGEGKTAIIAMLATLFSWEVKKVDVGEFTS